MQVSKQLVEFLGSWEGFSLKPYLCPANVWTIGYGTTRINGLPVTEKTVITKEQAIQLKMLDLRTFENSVKTHVRSPLTQHQFDALVSLVYNIGGKAFSESTVCRRLNEGDYKRAADAFLLWNKHRVNGELVVSRGLQRRREAERDLFLNGTYRGA
jgi:lysozyme